MSSLFMILCRLHFLFSALPIYFSLSLALSVSLSLVYYSLSLSLSLLKSYQFFELVFSYLLVSFYLRDSVLTQQNISAPMTLLASLLSLEAILVRAILHSLSFYNNFCLVFIRNVINCIELYFFNFFRFRFFVYS